MKNYVTTFFLLFLAFLPLSGFDSDSRYSGDGLSLAIAPAVIAALATAAGGLAAAGINAASNAYSNRQNQRNWELQNQYNTPAAQLERYRAAGLNPNLIYGNGQSSSGNADAIAPYTPTKVSTNDLVQMANVVAQIRNFDANARKANAEALGQELANQERSTFLQYQDSALELDNRLRFARVAYTNGLTDQLGYQRAVLNAQAENLLEQAAYNRYNRKTLQPALLQLRRQQVANETAFNKSRLESMFTERIGARTRNSMLQFEKEHQAKDWLANRRGNALRSAAGALSAITGFSRFYDEYDWRHSYYSY